MKSITALDTAFQEDLARIRGARIFFGHQSVGQNVLDALTGLWGENSPELNIVKVHSEETMPSGPCLAHASIGENMDPKTKTRDFGKFLNEQAGGPWDVALMKFCYLDITRETDVPNLFRAYRDKVAEIRRDHPRLILVHVTVPLTCESRMKTLIKKVLGKTTTGDNNIKRFEYNALLLSEFGKEPIFDLSRIESTHADGSRESFRRGGQPYFGLVREYTEDGGHLNETGSKVLAREFVRVLAEALTMKPGAERAGE